VWLEVEREGALEIEKRCAFGDWERQRSIESGGAVLLGFHMLEFCPLMLDIV